MRIVYLGTPEFSVLPLKKLIESKHEVVAVVTNLDKPVGRKQILTPSPVKVEALKNNIPVLQYKRIRLEGVEDLKRLKPDLMVTCAFGQILSQEILDIPKIGVINIHASILPELRGASPIHYAILQGKKQTGITIMKTDAGVDTGDIIIQKSVEIRDDETCGELFDKLSPLGAEMLIETLDLIESGKVKYIKQDNDKATFTSMIKKEDALIRWADKNVNIYNKIRAFNPSPVAFTLLNGQPLKIFKAKISNGKGQVGEVISNDNVLEIACGEGSLIIENLQKAGGNPMNVKDFLRGNRIPLGTVLG